MDTDADDYVSGACRQAARVALVASAPAAVAMVLLHAVEHAVGEVKDAAQARLAVALLAVAFTTWVVVARVATSGYPGSCETKRAWRWPSHLTSGRSFLTRAYHDKLAHSGGECRTGV